MVGAYRFCMSMSSATHVVKALPGVVHAKSFAICIEKLHLMCTYLVKTSFPSVWRGIKLWSACVPGVHRTPRESWSLHVFFAQLVACIYWMANIISSNLRHTHQIFLHLTNHTLGHFLIKLPSSPQLSMITPHLSWHLFVFVPKTINLL
jgi:hypothetical protein